MQLSCSSNKKFNLCFSCNKITFVCKHNAESSMGKENWTILCCLKEMRLRILSYLFSSKTSRSPAQFNQRGSSHHNDSLDGLRIPTRIWFLPCHTRMNLHLAVIVGDCCFAKHLSSFCRSK